MGGHRGQPLQNYQHMKKILIIATIVSSLIANAASAKDGFYGGVDIIGLHLSAKVQDRGNYLVNNVGALPADPSTSNNGFGLGVNFGFKASVMTRYPQFFAAPEIFYDYFNLKVGDYYNAQNGNQGNKSSFRGRLGGKLNLGVNITEAISPYLTFGFARVDYVLEQPTANASEAASKTAPIYGVGIALRVTENLKFRAEYNRQDFNIKYAVHSNNVDQFPISKVSLQAFKLGLVYGF
jgi:outer membrane autotransporter protein